MVVDWNLIRKAKDAANGANVHEINNIAQSYISLIDAAASTANIKEFEYFTQQAKEYEKRLEVIVGQEKLRKARLFIASRC